VSTYKETFRFEKVWLSLIQSAWTSIHVTGSAPKRMVHKLRELRKIIKNWTKEHFHSIKRTKSKLLDDLLLFETMDEDEELSAEDKFKKQSVAGSLNIILKEEEVIWR